MDDLLDGNEWPWVVLIVKVACDKETYEEAYNANDEKFEEIFHGLMWTPQSLALEREF